MKRRTCKSVSLHCCNTTLSSYDMYEEREGTPFAKVFPRSYQNIELCRKISIPHLKKKRKGEISWKRIFQAKLDLKLPSGQKPTFFRHFIYFSLFFFAFKCKEKVGKWAEKPQSLVPQRFPAAHFSKINGQKVGKWP